MESLISPASLFKAKLGQYMRAVRRGKSVVVTDRDQPVARFVPFEDESSPTDTGWPRDPAAPPLGQVIVQSIQRKNTDTTQMLLDDRARR
jgi:prevent-host-death family protein